MRRNTDRDNDNAPDAVAARKESSYVAELSGTTIGAQNARPCANLIHGIWPSFDPLEPGLDEAVNAGPDVAVPRAAMLHLSAKSRCPWPRDADDAHRSRRRIGPAKFSTDALLAWAMPCWLVPSHQIEARWNGAGRDNESEEWAHRPTAGRVY